MTSDTHHLAELNIGRLLAPTDDPRVAVFMAALNRLVRVRTVVEERIKAKKTGRMGAMAAE
jgi:hypothetical protein